MKPLLLPIALAVSIVLGTRAASADPVTIAVTGTVNEPVSSVMVNGIAAVINGTTFTAGSVPLTIGPNIITVTATDLANNTSTASIAVHLAVLVNVQGAVTDQSAVTVTVNGVPAAVTAGTFSASIQMTLGANTVTVQAQDATGNTSTATSQVFLARPPVEHP